MRLVRLAATPRPLHLRFRLPIPKGVLRFDLLDLLTTLRLVDLDPQLLDLVTQ